MSKHIRSNYAEEWRYSNIQNIRGQGNSAKERRKAGFSNREIL